MRNYSFIDEIIINIDFTAKTIFGGHRGERHYPPKSTDTSLNSVEKKHSIGLMRVNNVGEVCAQALYQGQALASNNKELIKELEDAAVEEIDHLYWTEQRIRELGGSLSYFNWVWFAGSFSMGYVAGLLGDEWNLSLIHI